MLKEIELDGVTLRYDETGPASGDPVVLMHGWGCQHSTVAFIEQCISGKMHVFNLDLPGHGMSTEPPEAWGIEKFTSFVEKFIATLGIKCPVLIGHSFGGRISILLASRNDVAKVVLVDSAGIKPKRPLKYYYKVYSFKFLKKVAPLILGKTKANEIIERKRSKSGSADYRNSSPMMRAVMSRCVNEDLRHVMPSIKAPTLLVWGENDTATPISDAKLMESLIPDAGLVSFPGCGHYSFLDNPGQFKAVIQNFLKI